MANEETGKGKLGKPKDLTNTTRDPLPVILDEDTLNAKQDRQRIRRRKGPDMEEEEEERGLFDREPDEDEPPTDCDE